MENMIKLSDTADSSPITRKCLRTELFNSALDAVKAGQDIEAVATAYHIPRFFLEGEPLPPYYFEEPPIETDPWDFDWRRLVDWCRENGREVYSVSRSELQEFKRVWVS